MIRRILPCLFVTLLTLITLANFGRGQENKEPKDRPKTSEPSRPKEALVESIIGDIDPEVRRRMVEQLEREIRLLAERLKEERQQLSDLEERVQEQQAKVRRTDLTLGFLKDRLAQWSADPDDKESPDPRAEH